MKIMIDMLDDYIHHITTTTNGMSLLAKIYGIFTIVTKDLVPLNIVIMQNTAVLVNPDQGFFNFDLKGSLY